MIKLEEFSYNDEVILTIGFDDKDNSVVLIDKNNNKVSLGSNGISFTSVGEINIKSQGNITIDGLSIAINAENSLTAKGIASAELSSSGQSKVKGALVMIN